MAHATPAAPIDQLADADGHIIEPGDLWVERLPEDLRPLAPHFFRDDEGVKQGLEIVKRLKEEAQTAYIDDQGTVFNQDVLGAIELGYMLDCAECACVGALHRTESRGAQFRTDFPERDDDTWLKHIDLSRNGDETPNVSYSPVTITQWQPEERKY